jgi:succinate dehydrogenase / fumarate reductase cytochrome b subunit
MVGNLQVFLGAEVFNAYGEWIQESEWVWPMRGLMLVLLITHVVSAISLIQNSNRARRVAYQHARKDQATTMAARSMRWGGVAILAFLVFHLLDLTFGVVHPSFHHGDAYHNLTTSLSNPVVAGVYVLANLVLSLHLYHGVWSMIHSLGVIHPAVQAWRRALGLFFGALIPTGNVIIALACVAGLV